MRARLGILLTLLCMAACSGDRSSGLPLGPVEDLSADAACQSPTLQLNQVQSIGSHNSYKQAIPRLEMMALRRSAEEVADTLDYAHLPLTDQLDLGMRQLELDVFYDPDGGRYATPYLPGALPWLTKRYNVPQMAEPGFKVMHVQDIDQRSHCPLFKDCLGEISDWSDAHPDHTPILILINAKQAPIPLDDAVAPLPFTAQAFEALDAEIVSTLNSDKLITPDTVRGGANTLRDAVLQAGWPTYNAARGKLIFALDENAAEVEVYLRGNASLEGLPMFVNTTSEQADHAAYFTRNSPLTDGAEIAQLVEVGFLIRTRADADTVEARTYDTSRREAAFASGAQYISTDYYRARKKFSDYAVAFPNETVTRCLEQE